MCARRTAVRVRRSRRVGGLLTVGFGAQGGANAIVKVAGKDATKQFNMLHDADKVLAEQGHKFVIGVVDASAPVSKL